MGDKLGRILGGTLGDGLGRRMGGTLSDRLGRRLSGTLDDRLGGTLGDSRTCGSHVWVLTPGRLTKQRIYNY